MAFRAINADRSSAVEAETLTFEMEANALDSVRHQGFVVDAQAMAALLNDFATRADLRAAVKREFETTKTLFGMYQEGLKKAYEVPVVREPK